MIHFYLKFASIVLFYWISYLLKRRKRNFDVKLPRKSKRKPFCVKTCSENEHTVWKLLVKWFWVKLIVHCARLQWKQDKVQLNGANLTTFLFIFNSSIKNTFHLIFLKIKFKTTWTKKELRILFKKFVLFILLLSLEFFYARSLSFKILFIQFSFDVNISFIKKRLFLFLCYLKIQQIQWIHFAFVYFS